MNQTKMVTEEKAEDSMETQAARLEVTPEKTGVQDERPLSELGEMQWSVVSFDKCEAGGLTYVQAEEKMAELLANNVYGLCIVTDNAAEKVR